MQFFARHKFLWIVLAVVAIAITGALTWPWVHPKPPTELSALDSVDEYELLSLKGNVTIQEEPGPPNPALSRPHLYGHEILGRTMIADLQTRRQLNGALKAGVRENNGEAAACFNPRHAIRVTRAGVTTEFLICFECSRVEVWRNDKEIAKFLVTASPQPVFDGVLKSAGVPLDIKSPQSE
ncbi:MAG TPA: hypothetical protein VIL86_01390 [Tepidisphaeraceae bacterium]